MNQSQNLVKCGVRVSWRPSTRWSDDIQKVTGSVWMHRAEVRAQWCANGEVYVSKHEQADDDESQNLTTTLHRTVTSSTATISSAIK